MDYAIVLYFDKETEARFAHITRLIADGCGNRYIPDAGIKPHITIAYFSTESVGDIIEALDRERHQFPPGQVVWASIGAFVPKVLFAAPVLNEYLLKSCIRANELTAPYADAGDGGHYVPYQWVPHTALAVRLDEGELRVAFDVASGNFSPLSGMCDRLALAQCNPFKEIGVWGLGG